MTSWVEQLRRTASGRVHAGSEVSRASGLDLYARPHATPAATLAAHDVGDVQAAVRLARDYEIPLSIRGGGHSGAAFAAVEEGLMLDLSELREVRVDPGRRRAWATAGATWGDYDSATQQHGLASTGGIVSSTGVVGLTLGGGVGALRGLHGLAVDNVRAFDVVLTDGSVARADAVHEPDLFWALRGGGGNFAVVTEAEFTVHPVTEVTTGLLEWPLHQAQTVAAAYRARAEELPDHTVADLIFGYTDRDEASVLILPRVIGNSNTAAPLIDHLRAAAPPVADSISTRGYLASQNFLDTAALWRQRVYWNTTTLRHFDENVIETLNAYIRSAPSRDNRINVEHFHGAVSRIDPASTAVGFRHATYNVFVEAKWDDPGADGDNQAWARELVDALSPHSAGGAYVNYLPRDAEQNRIRDAYGPATYERLRGIKTKYDPDNLLRANQNIHPADTTTR